MNKFINKHLSSRSFRLTPFFFNTLNLRFKVNGYSLKWRLPHLAHLEKETINKQPIELTFSVYGNFIELLGVVKLRALKIHNPPFSSYPAKRLLLLKRIIVYVCIFHNVLFHNVFELIFYSISMTLHTI